MKSRNEKLKLYIVLTQGLGLLVTLVASLVGGMYMFGGNLIISFPISIIFVVVLYYLVVFFCKEKENRRKKGYPPIFYYLFALYALVSVFLSFFVLHCFNVEVLEKKEIQNTTLLKLEGLEKIYADYNEQYNTFSSTLKTDLIGKIKKLKQNRDDENLISALKEEPYNLDDGDIQNYLNVSDLSRAVNERIKLLNDDFQNKEKELLSNKEEYFSLANDRISKWDRLRISSTMKELDSKITEDYEALNGLLKDKSANNFKLTVSQQPYLKESMLQKPMQLASKHIGVSTILVLLVFQLIILLPYFLTKGRNYGGN
jgi:hypothetical protein